MPIHHIFREDHKVIITVHLGETPDDEFIVAYRNLYNDPRFSIELDRLVDLRQAQSGNRSSEAIKTIADLIKMLYGVPEKAVRTAFIAPKDVSFGLARMYQIFSDTVPGKLLVARESSEALQWLGLSLSVLEEAAAEAETRNQDLPENS
jgi:hypothetical protein